MDFFDDLRDDEPLDEERLEEFGSGLDDDDEAVDELSSAELEFVELPYSAVPPVEMPSPAVEWPNAAGIPFEPGLQPVPMPGARGPAFDFSMLVGPGFGEGFAEIPRPRQPRRMPFSPPADSGALPQRRDYDWLFRRGEDRARIEQLPLKPHRDRSFDVSDALMRDDSDGPIVQATSSLPAASRADSSLSPAVASSTTPGDYKPLGQPRPTALVQLLDYDQLFLKEQRAFETRLAEVAKEIAKREVDHAAWVDYIHQRAIFGTR